MVRNIWRRSEVNDNLEGNCEPCLQARINPLLLLNRRFFFTERKGASLFLVVVAMARNPRAFTTHCMTQIGQIKCFQLPGKKFKFIHIWFHRRMIHIACHPVGWLVTVRLQHIYRAAGSRGRANGTQWWSGSSCAQ